MVFIYVYESQEKCAETDQKNEKSGNGKMKNSEGNFTFRQAFADDAEAMHRVMTAAAGSLHDKTLYVCDDLDYVKHYIQTDGFGIVACDEEQVIVGILLCRFPGRADNNLGRDIQLEESELDQVVHVESAAVLPECSGNHLMERMMICAQGLIDKGKYKYLLATVSPDNPASFMTLEKCGFRAVMTKEKYGGLLRRIYQKEL